MMASALAICACAVHPGPDRTQPAPDRPGYQREMGQHPEKARHREKAQYPEKTQHLEKAQPREFGSTREGMVSFYADKFHGRQTASGERFDKNALTAAHRSLPFGTKVKVTNLSNGKSVVVVINDRGPFVKNRILDLAPAAAGKIGMLEKGTVKARIEVQ